MNKKYFSVILFFICFGSLNIIPSDQGKDGIKRSSTIDSLNLLGNQAHYGAVAQNDIPSTEQGASPIQGRSHEIIEESNRWGKSRSEVKTTETSDGRIHIEIEEEETSHLYSCCTSCVEKTVASIVAVYNICIK